MTWIVWLITVYILVGLRARSLRGSTHLIILVISALTLGVVWLQPVSAP